jgi:cytidyltransferase-like protein
MNSNNTNDNKYKRVYTVGCFDWFHYGHENFLNKLKAKGDIVIVGIHDDNSLEKLKNLKDSEHQHIKERIHNVKSIVDIVYVIPDTDPTFWLKSVVLTEDNKENACFIRADDMPNFPGRDFVDSKMSLKFIKYTDGISSTQIRNKMKDDC